MKIIYLVIGQTGEYADYREWNVCAYSNEEEANEHCKLAQSAANTIPYRNFRLGETTNPFDPRMDMDYTGTTYEVRKQDFYESLSDFKLINDCRPLLSDKYPSP